MLLPLVSVQINWTNSVTSQAVSEVHLSIIDVSAAARAAIFALGLLGLDFSPFKKITTF